MKNYRMLVFIGLVLSLSLDSAVAQGLKDLEGFWCEPHEFDRAGKCAMMSRGQELDRRWKISTAAQGAVIRIDPPTFGGVRIVGRMEGSDDRFRGEGIDEFPYLDRLVACGKFPMNGTVSRDRNTIIFKYEVIYRPTHGPCPGRPNPGTAEVILIRMR